MSPISDMLNRAVLLLALLLAACEPTPSAHKPSEQKPAPLTLVSAPSLSFPAPKRLVAFADVHGDLQATLRALQLGGATDDKGTWIGGDLFVVQTGDQLDRGDDDRAILDLFKRLELQAKAAGGTFLALNGNHELMNVAFDFRYVTDGSNPAFDEFRAGAPDALSKFPQAQRGRAAAFMPGGNYAKLLAERPLVAIVGDSVFVHGGLLMKHLDYGLEKLDGETRAWLRGERPTPPAIVVSEDGPVWARHYSAAPGREECAQLKKVLEALGARRMVMGHTPQKPKASVACDGQAWRIDTGMARHYGGPINVLEIVGDSVKVLEE